MFHRDKLRYVRTYYKFTDYYPFSLVSFGGYILPGGQNRCISWLQARGEVGLTRIPHKEFSTALCNLEVYISIV